VPPSQPGEVHQSTRPSPEPAPDIPVKVIDLTTTRHVPTVEELLEGDIEPDGITMERDDSRCFPGGARAERNLANV